MSTLLPVFASITHECQFTNLTDHGYERVMVHPDLKLCEVGQGCYSGCQYSFQPQDLQKCPTCGGSPDIDNPPYSCSTCDVFGVMRKPDVSND